MSDWIEHDGKKYYEESYLVLANNNAKRAKQETAYRCAVIAELQRIDKEGHIILYDGRDIATRILREFGLPTPESDSTASTTHENPKSDKLTSCPTDLD